MEKQVMKGPGTQWKKRAVPEIGGQVWHSGDDLAAENLMNDFDMTAADLQDFGRA